MSGPLTRTAGPSIGTFLPTYWDAVLGENLYPNLTLYAYGTKRQIPRQFGLSIKIPRLRKRSGVVTLWHSASEGNAILGSVPTCAAQSEFVSGTLKQFIGVYRHSDIVIMTALSDIIDLSLKDIARDLALQMDTHIRDNTSGSGKTVWASGVSNGAASITAIRASNFLKAAAILDGSNNPRPAGGHYPAVIHPFQQFDLQSQLTGNSWLEINKYKGNEEPENLYRAELGRLFGCVLTTSTNVARVFKTGTTPLPAGKRFGAVNSAVSGWFAPVLAPEAYYVTEMNDMTAKTFVKQLGSAGAFDPVNTVATVGAKVFFTAIPADYKTTSGSTVTSDIRMVHILAQGSRL